LPWSPTREWRGWPPTTASTSNRRRSRTGKRPVGRSISLSSPSPSTGVQPERALDKVASILRPGGRLALLSNRISPVSPTRQQLDEAYSGFLDPAQRPAIDAVHDDALMAMITEHGYTIERRQVTEQLHYDTEAWVNMVFTYSNVLTLGPQARSELRCRLEQVIGTAGVDAENDATAVICTLQ
jgi:hypothetical protein